MSYDFNEHKHRYAVWIAARAVQRSFTTTNEISVAIQSTDLREICESPKTFTSESFDEQHRKWGNTLIRSFAASNIACSYGRAAKIIAIYIKTSIVLPTQGLGLLAEVAHPPLDSILLSTLSKNEQMKSLCVKRWTNFTLEDYWVVIALIRSVGLPVNWRLEEWWKREKEVKRVPI